MMSPSAFGCHSRSTLEPFQPAARPVGFSGLSRLSETVSERLPAEEPPSSKACALTVYAPSSTASGPYAPPATLPMFQLKPHAEPPPVGAGVWVEPFSAQFTAAGVCEVVKVKGRLLPLPMYGLAAVVPIERIEGPAASPGLSISVVSLTSFCESPGFVQLT